MDAAPLRGIIAEDSTLIREGIARRSRNRGSVVAKVGDGPAFVEAVETHRPDVSVVDVRMPPSHATRGCVPRIEARRRVPGTPILVLSQYVERQYATELLADGAGGVGYLLKDRVGDIQVHGRAASRRPWRDRARPRGRGALMVRNRADDPLAALTPRGARCSPRWPKAAPTSASPGCSRSARRDREAHQQHLKLELPHSQDDHRRVRRS